MGISDRIPLRLSLMEMYIPLKARLEMPKGETWIRSIRSNQGELNKIVAQEEDTSVIKSAPIVDLIIQNKCLIILGDPGAGKTTLMKYLTLNIANGKGSEIGMEDRIPFLLPLSAYAHELKNGDIPLERFIKEYYSNRINGKNFDVIDHVLALGKGLILLDGLDEIGELSYRHFTLNRVIDFLVNNLKLGNKVVITSRIIGYREIRPVLDDIVECTLVDLEDDEINKFVSTWTNVFEKTVRGDSTFAKSEASREKEELLEAISRNNSIRKLASNPLLLTILVLMKRQGISLPDRRVELYQRYIDTLINQWNLTRGLDRSTSQAVNVSEVIKVLAPLAIWMHTTNAGNGLVKGRALLNKLIELFEARGAVEPELAAEKFLSDIHDHAGLIVERGADEYGFIHLTFQEYLSAVGIAQKGQKDLMPLIDDLLAHINEDNWHEIILLTLGYIGNIQQRDEAAGTILESVINCNNAFPNSVIVAGDALIDLWPGGINETSKNKVISAIKNLLNDKRVIAPNIRVKAGDQLARIGDSRPGVNLNDFGLPDITWCDIPEGTFYLGNPTNVEDIIADETPQMEVFLHQYKISKYLITNKQYNAFVTDNGYTSIWRSCWTDDGWAWKKDRTGPDKLGGKYDIENHPIVMVTWFEAVAFSQWLMQRYRQAGIISDTTLISLPTEAQWEKASRGVDGRVYPWGKKPNPNFANYRDTGIFATSSVGIFRGGKSSFGSYDMSGNVWEWCLSKYTDNYHDYPIELFEFHQDSLSGSVERILRGGSFNDQDVYIRCATRNWNQPDIAIRDVGFRIVMIDLGK